MHDHIVVELRVDTLAAHVLPRALPMELLVGEVEDQQPLRHANEVWVRACVGAWVRAWVRACVRGWSRDK